MIRNEWSGVVAAVASGFLAACSGGDATSLTPITVSSCMQCHNATLQDNYGGPGIENPHPFPGADELDCVRCHGGNPDGTDQLTSHIPAPPEIGDREFWTVNRQAYFNRLTLTGIDKLADYVVDGTSYTALDYLQFINPGDLRVVTRDRGCGECHENHAQVVERSILATETGLLSGGLYMAGDENRVPENAGFYEDTAADVAFRAVVDPNFDASTTTVGDVVRLIEFPVMSLFGAEGALDLFKNDAYLAADLSDDINGDNRVIANSPLSHLMAEMTSFACGDCHLGSAGANNRYGDYRSSGCSACHMPYSQSGRSGSADPNINKLEPLDPDDIDEPELAHVRSHRIVSVAKTLSNGATVEGMDDHTCAGCHQGSNRTVLQYWGIRLDQNEDVRRGNQYPANPVTFQDTRDDTRLFDPVIENNTFNGRNHRQLLAFEDYDGDGRDDTPADVHYEAGMGCIDCHGSFDLHGGDVAAPDETGLVSRMEQAVAIRCESCHGSVSSYAAVISGTGGDGEPTDFAVDSAGNLLTHVERDAEGNYFLTSRLTQARHFVPQTMDAIVDSGRVNPGTQLPLYSARASYAMGRADGNPLTGLGPQQTGGVTNGFSHADDMNCAACHSSWTNSCTGCHAQGEYTTNSNNFSNITGERIVFELDADFVYQSPLPFQIGVNPRGEVAQVTPNTKLFFKYEDRNNDESQVFAFSDRNANGNNPSSANRALGHNAMMAHSIRGKVDAQNEGPRYCVACHLTDSSMASYGAEYGAFRTAMTNADYGALDFDLLKEHIGQNPGNQLDSPLWVHMAAGLGSGLYLFDADGCAVNPLDDNADRAGCDGVAPASNFDPNRAFFNLDRLVEANGIANSSSHHPLQVPGTGTTLRDGALNTNLAGPLGSTLVRRLTDPSTGIVLDSWLDADGVARGNAGGFLTGP